MIPLISKIKTEKDIISFTSEAKEIAKNATWFTKGQTAALSWSSNVYYRQYSCPGHQQSSIYFHWCFDWQDQEMNGMKGFTGRINVRYYSVDDDMWMFDSVDVELSRNNQKADKVLDCPITDRHKIQFDMIFVPIFTSKPPVEVDKLFAPSEQNDTVLIVDGHKLHVNKAFLSYHSEFFRALFSANFAESGMTEIPIRDVPYENFCTLLKVVYPRPQFPNDASALTLLELADRFMMPGVIDHVEQYLMSGSSLSNASMIWMADKFGLSKLLDRCIGDIECRADLRRIKNSENYNNLSDYTKSKILDRIMNNFTMTNANDSLSPVRRSYSSMSDSSERDLQW